MGAVEKIMCVSVTKGDLFVLSWARVRRVRRGSISSELLRCGGGVGRILLLPIMARCLETIDVCCGNVCCVAALLKSVFLSLGVFKYVVCFCRGCDGCSFFCLYCDAWRCRFVSCVYPMAVINAAFLHDLQFVNAGRG